MRLLILGGTIFLGRHIVATAIARGDDVTIFNRGQHNPEIFPDVEKLHGNRDGELAALQGRKWDAVIDTCGYVPRIVRASAELLADSVEHYTFISSLSVYKDFSQPYADESAVLGTVEDPTIEEVTGETYGPLKALCEQAAEAAMPGRVLNVRAGLIVGPHDQSDRFTYWPHRMAKGGEVLAPDGPSEGAQFIDVRDLAEWILRMVDARKAGDYNATGKPDAVTMGDVLEASKQVSGSDARITWASEEFLLENKVEPWSQMPLWVSGEDAVAFNTTDCSKAVAAGLTFRPLVDTVRDTLEWSRTRPADHTWKAGISAQREAELLGLWHAEGH